MPRSAPWSVATSDGEQPPFPRNALQHMPAPVLESNACAGHQVLHRTGEQDLARGGECRLTGADLHSDATHLVADRLALSRVQPGPDLDPELPDGVANGTGTVNRLDRLVEDSQKAIASRIDLTTLKPC